MIHDMDNDDGHPNANNVVVLFIAMGSAAFVVSIYHLIAILLCNHHITTDQNNQPEQQQQPPRAASAPPAPTSNLNQSSSSLTHMIPAHKYHKKKKKVDQVVSDDDDGTCAVCLGDFEEGEELRTLPECLHSFHVPCIDMWLNSHTSCPICRASATPSPAILHNGPMPGFGSGDQFNNAHHSIDMTQIALVQNGLVRR